MSRSIPNEPEPGFVRPLVGGKFERPKLPNAGSPRAGKNMETDSQSVSAVSITLKQDGKARHWSITLNNPTAEELSLWENATQNQWVKSAVGQLERGEETETLHLQGYLRTDNVRFAQVKKLFPRAHIEVARNPTALQQYAQKEDTRVATLKQTASSVMVLTPRKLQDRLAYVVCDMVTHKGQACKWTRKTVFHGEYPYRYGSIEWVKEVGEDLICYPYYDIDAWIRCIEENAAYIRVHADKVVDTAVREEITAGTFGAEYATANVACFAALKRYIVEILIRNANQTRSEEEARWTQGTPRRPTLEDVS